MKTTIIIEIKGGCLTAVHSNEPIDYVLIDHDNNEELTNCDMYENDSIFTELNATIDSLVS